MTALYMITVYCQEPSHAERRWIIRTFMSLKGMVDSLGGNGWASAPSRFSGDRKKLLGEAKTMTRLTGDRYMPREEGAPDFGATRYRPRLKCKLCGLAYVRHDTTELYAIFDKLQRAGVKEISIRALINEGAKIANSTE